MRRDVADAYRALLNEDPPRLTTYVNTPWEDIPDHAAFNAGPFRLVERRLKAMARRGANGEPVPAQGVLILGEAGAGKTHLLMRVARTLSATNPVMFIHKPNNEEAVAQHVWSHLVESLTRHVPGLEPGQSQLDHLLAHVFTAVLVPLLELDISEGVNAKQKQRWLGRLKEGPRNLFDLIEPGPNRQKSLDYLRNKVLGHLRVYHPDVDQSIARALVNYCFLATDRDRRAMLTWLMGQQVDEPTMRRLGVAPLWPEPTDETASDDYIRQERERQALVAIRTIGDLSRYYHKPLILAFDQLEGLRGERRLTQRFADVVQQVFTVAPNFLIVTCIFPSLWETWFDQELHQAVKDRIAADQVTLDRFGPEHAEALLSVHLADAVAAHRLPDALYPFEATDVADLCARAASPRNLLQLARRRLDDWLNQDDSPAPVAAPAPAPAMPAPVGAESAPVVVIEAPVVVPVAPATAAVREAFGRFRASRLAGYEAGIPNEEDLFGRISRVARALAHRRGRPGPLGPGATHGQRVMPANVVFRGEPALCWAVCNSQGAALKARLENLAGVLAEGRQCQKVVLLRDGRCPAPGGQGETLWRSIGATSGQMLILDAVAWSELAALSDLLTAAEQKDLGTEAGPIAESAALAVLAGDGTLAQIGALAALVAVAPWLAELVGAEVVAEGPTLAVPAIDEAPDVQPELGELLRALFPGDPIRATAAPLPPLLDVPGRAVTWAVSGPAVEVGPDDRINPSRVEKVVMLVADALSRGVAADQIVVVCSYPAQAASVRQALGNPAVNVVADPADAAPADLAILEFTDEGMPPLLRNVDRARLRAALRLARRQVAVVANPRYLTNFQHFAVADLVLFRALLGRAPVVRAAVAV